MQGGSNDVKISFLAQLEVGKTTSLIYGPLQKEGNFYVFWAIFQVFWIYVMWISKVGCLKFKKYYEKIE